MRRKKPYADRIERGYDTQALVHGETTEAEAEVLARSVMEIGPEEEEDGPLEVGEPRHYRAIPDPTGKYDTRIIESKPGPGAFLARIVK